MTDKNTVTATGERGVEQLKSMLAAVDKTEVQHIEVTLTYEDDDDAGPESPEETDVSDSGADLPREAWKVDHEQVTNSIADVPQESDRLVPALKWIGAQDEPVIFTDVQEAMEGWDKTKASTALGDLFRRGAVRRRGSPPYKYEVSTAGANVIRKWANE